MTIDFYSKDDRNQTKSLYRLFYEDFISLNSFFKEFERRTGVFVDPYGTTNMGSGHLEILSEILSGNHLHLEKVLTKYASEDQDLVFEGD